MAAQMYWRGGNSNLWDETRERQLQETIQAAGGVIAQANADMSVYLAMGIRFYQEMVNKLQVGLVSTTYHLHHQHAIDTDVCHLRRHAD